MATETHNTSTTWTCPEGVTSVAVACRGAGGGGGFGGTEAGSGGDGGGGGAYAYKSGITVVAGTGYAIVVGAGGATDTQGGDSYFISTGTVMAKGGQYGQHDGGSGSAGQGGQASASVGDTKYDGGDGGGRADNGGGGGGEGAASTAGGGSGGTASGDVGGSGGTGGDGGDGGAGGNIDTNGFEGTAPGGGGGGAGRGASVSKTGGEGADGQVVLVYYVGYSDSLTETITVSADATGLQGYVESLTENITVTSSAVGYKTYNESLTESITLSSVATDAVGAAQDFAYIIGSDTGATYELSPEYLTDGGFGITAKWETNETDFKVPAIYKTVYSASLRYVDKTASTVVNVSASTDGGQTWTAAYNTIGTGDDRTHTQKYFYNLSGEYFKFKVEVTATNKEFQIIGLDIDYSVCGDTTA